MSEQPAQYGDHPVPAPIVTRVERVERDLVRLADLQEKNASAIAALVNSVDQMRATFDGRMSAIERGIAALNESNKLLAELITSRLPAPPTAE